MDYITVVTLITAVINCLINFFGLVLKIIENAENNKNRS